MQLEGTEELTDSDQASSGDSPVGSIPKYLASSHSKITKAN